MGSRLRTRLPKRNREIGTCYTCQTNSFGVLWNPDQNRLTGRSISVAKNSGSGPVGRSRDDPAPRRDHVQCNPCQNPQTADWEEAENPQVQAAHPSPGQV